MNKKSLPGIWIVLLVGAIIFGLAFAFLDRSNFYFQQIASIFDFSENESNIERRLQFDALLSGFKNNFLFGAGAGAAASYSRSDIYPWAYELSYLAFAFQYGLIGFFLYASGVAYLLFGLIRIAREGRSKLHLCILTGLISFLIANSTNPYLAKFDYMWVIFIPFALVNFNSSERRRKEVHA